MLVSYSRKLATPIILALLISYISSYLGINPTSCKTLFVTVICAFWWVLEPIPIAATSLIPLALFPLLGVLNVEELASAYGHPLILLLMGGFMLSKALEQSNTHKRLALYMINIFGQGSDRGLVGGFMITSAILSMWISNTATTLMLLPVALAIIDQSKGEHLSTPLLLGIAYASSLGGIGTPIGTPPNLILMSVYTENTGRIISFSQWAKWSIPVIIVVLPIMFVWLTRNLKTKQSFRLPSNSAWSAKEKRILGIFILTALAWITRTEPFGGWKELLSISFANDTSVAMASVLALFIIPDGQGSSLLDWETANKIPWHVVLLFGGGIAIAKAFVSSGLSDEISSFIVQFRGYPTLSIVAILTLAISFLTELTSNTATTNLLMPILAATATSANLDPAILMVPAAMAASCAFMLPVATAPNTIIFGSQKVPIKSMLREGLVLNLVAVLAIILVCHFLF
ncbi:MAG: DASS family sodium-coupled anion symporter [Oligoflexales bacterium]